MMNLKDAFRFQNVLQSFIEESLSILSERGNILKVTTTYLRSKVVTDDPDVEIAEAFPSKFTGRANEVVDFVVMLMAEKEKLSQAISEAKRKLPFDMDCEIGLNHQRQKLSDVFRQMNQYQSGEKIRTGGGMGYRFNTDGNQVTYKCDAKEVTTIDFKRDKVRSLAAIMSQKADDISMKLDKAMVNTEVDYSPTFDVNDSFDIVLDDFVKSTAKADTTA